MKNFDFCSLEQNQANNVIDHELVLKAQRVLQAQEKASKDRKKRAEDVAVQKERSDETVLELKKARRRSHVRGSYRPVAQTQANGFGLPVEARPARLPPPRFHKQKPINHQQALEELMSEGSEASPPTGGGNFTSRSQDTTISHSSMLESIKAITAPSPKPRTPQHGNNNHQDPVMPSELAMMPLHKHEEVTANLRDLTSIMDMTRSSSANAVYGMGDPGSGSVSPSLRRRRAAKKKREFYSVLPSLSRGGIAARQKLREADNVRNEIEIKRQQALEKKHRMVFTGSEHDEHQLYGKSSKVAIAEELVVLKSIMIREQILLTLVTLLKQLELDYHRYQHYKRKKIKHHQHKHRGPHWIKKEEHIDLKSRQIGVEVHLRQKEMAALLAQLRAASLETVEAVQDWRERHDKDVKGRFFGKNSTGTQAKAPTRTFRWQGQNYLIKMQHDLDHLDHFSVIEAWVGFPLASNPLLMPPEPFEWIEELAKMKEELGERLKKKRALKAQSRAEQIRAKMGGSNMNTQSSQPITGIMSRQASARSGVLEGAEASPQHSPGKSPRRRNSLEHALMLGGVDGFEAALSRTPRSLAANTHAGQPSTQRRDTNASMRTSTTHPETGRSRYSSSLNTSRRNTNSRANTKAKDQDSEDEKEKDATEESEMSSGIEEVICFPDLVPEDQMVRAFPQALRARAKRVEQILKNENEMEQKEQRERMDKVRRQHMSQQHLQSYSDKNLRSTLQLTDEKEDHFKKALMLLQEDTSLAGSRASLHSTDSAVFITELRKDIAHHKATSPQPPERKAVKFNQSKLKARMEAEKEASRKLKLMPNRRTGARKLPKAIKGGFVVPATTKFQKDKNPQIQINAVIKVQSNFRGHLARLRAEKVRKRREAWQRDRAARKIQASFRGMEARRTANDIRVQVSAQLLRKKNLLKKEFRAACRIQRFFKNVVAEAKEYRHKQYLASNAKIIHDGALKIQRLYRLLIRSRARHRKMAHEQRVAARKIQKMVRNHQKYRMDPSWRDSYPQPQQEEGDPSALDPKAMMAAVEPSVVKLQAQVRMKSAQRRYRRRRMQWLEDNRKRQESVLQAAQLAIVAAQQAADEFEDVQNKLPSINSRFVPKQQKLQRSMDESVASAASKASKQTNSEGSRKMSGLPSIKQQGRRRQTSRSNTKKAPVQINIVDLL